MSEPLLFLPGLLCNERLFAPQREALASVEGRVIDLTRDASTEAMAERVLAEAPPRFALCGLSMGGYVALAVTLRAPERVSRLALLASRARADTPESKTARHVLIDLARSGRFAEVPDRVMPLFLHDERLDDAALTGLVRTMAMEVGADAFERQQTALLGREDLRHRLPEIGCRTHVLCGRQDALTSVPFSEEMGAAIPDATLVVVPRCGHLATLEQPQAVTDQLRIWLGR